MVLMDDRERPALALVLADDRAESKPRARSGPCVLGSGCGSTCERVRVLVIDSDCISG